MHCVRRILVQLCVYTTFFRVFIYIAVYGQALFSLLNSAEHEILSAQKYKNIKSFSFFEAQISL